MFLGVLLQTEALYLFTFIIFFFFEKKKKFLTSNIQFLNSFYRFYVGMSVVGVKYLMKY
jgi:hypothetical protein